MMDNKIHFFSNHTDTAFLEEFTGCAIEVIPYPYVLPEWTTEELRRKCNKSIEAAASADRLIINGDHTLVSLIVLERALLGKKTGFLAMKKLNVPSNNKEGNIIHTNVLKPISVRWL